MCRHYARAEVVDGNLNPAWQQAFFQSEFTHPGGGGRLTKRRGGTAALWKSLAGKERFPISTLVEQESLDQYLKKLEAGR